MLTYIWNRRYLILFFLVVVILFIFFRNSKDYEKSNALVSFRNYVVVFFLPVQNLTRQFKKSTVGIWQDYINLIGVQQENQLLKAKIEELKLENNKYSEVWYSYNLLRKYFDFQEQNNNLILAAISRIIPNNYTQLLVLNKGSKQGIKKNDAVITPNGIVGKILRVDDSLSYVQLITDIHSKIPILIKKNRTRSLLEGSSSGDLYARFIPLEINLKTGDIIITSGLAGIFPRGIFVGTIKEIYYDEFNPTQEVLVETKVDFSRLEKVFVIVDQSNNIVHPLFND